MDKTIKTFLKKIIHPFIVDQIRKLNNWFYYRNTKKIFRKVYYKSLWGNKDKDFYSGSGSEDSNSLPYIELVNKYLDEKGIKVIVDVGCGDFNVASKFNLCSRKYIGCDIVSELIDRNNKEFGSSNITFKSIDITRDNIPDGDVLLVRQVLQHLPNDYIVMFLKKIKKYNNVIITDALPNNNSHQINNDILPGAATRCEINGGLYLEHPPFNLNVEVLLDYPITDKTLRLRTVLVKNCDLLA